MEWLIIYLSAVAASCVLEGVRGGLMPGSVDFKASLWMAFFLPPLCIAGNLFWFACWTAKRWRA